jgi:hypothetical protein
MSGNGEHVVVHEQESSARCVSLSSFYSHTLAGCGGRGGGAIPAPLSAGTLPTPASLPSAQAWGGHFIETVKIGGTRPLYAGELPESVFIQGLKVCRLASVA